MQFSSAPALPARQPQTDSVRLQGRWLMLARTAWMIIALLSSSVFVASIPSSHARLQQVCVAELCGEMQLDPAGVARLEAQNLSLDFYATYNVALEVVHTCVSIAVGAFIFWRRSSERMALFVALLFVVAWIDPETLALMQPAWALPGAFLNFIGGISIICFFYLFPDGRFVPRWTRPLMIVWLTVAVFYHFLPESPLSLRRYPWLEGPFWGGVLLSGMAAQIYRYRRVSTPVQRQQTKWLVYGTGVTLLLGLPLLLSTTIMPSLGVPGSRGHLIATALASLFEFVLPLSIGLAVLRYRLWDIAPIINRTLVYAGLTASVIALYVLLVGYLSAIFQARGNLAISLIATGIVAVLFQPLRERLQRGVNRLMYGERDDPYAVISRLGQRLESTLAPDAVLPAIVQTVRESLKLPYVAIALREDDSYVIAAEAGDRKIGNVSLSPRHLVSLSLSYQGETVGQVLLARRSADESFGAADQRLLHDLTTHAGVAVHAVRLTHDLQRARERLVSTREEERRRLRRDLHDGLGPQLASQTLTIDAAIKLLQRDPATAAALLRELKAQSQAAITDIRRLVYDLRPPALDELGLLAAIREQAAQYAHAGLKLVVDAPESLPPLPAAVEVAAYRIAQEAITNVVRHAAAQTCHVTLLLDDSWLIIKVRDDGIGLPVERKAGVGLHSMCERAEELGGSLELESASGDGTHVRAHLPLMF